MSALTDTEVHTLASRVGPAIETIYAEFKKMLKQPEYAALADVINLENFKMFLLDSKSGVLQNFYSVQAEPCATFPHTTEAFVTVCFAFESTGASSCILEKILEKKELSSIGDDLDKCVNDSRASGECIWVFLDPIFSGKPMLFANSVVTWAGLQPDDYALLMRIDFDLYLD